MANRTRTVTAPTPAPAPKANTPRTRTVTPVMGYLTRGRVTPLVRAATTAPKATATKGIASTLASPVQVVWWLVYYNPGMARKAQMALCMAVGVNYSTARTQVQLARKAYGHKAQ